MVLPVDANIESVLPTLVHPTDYVCGVLDNMYRCKKLHGNASVLIGISGTGQRPYYRIVYSGPEGSTKVFDTFFDNHVSFKEEGRPIVGGHYWSDAIKSFDEVAALRGRLRGG